MARSQGLSKGVSQTPGTLPVLHFPMRKMKKGTPAPPRRQKTGAMVLACNALHSHCPLHRTMFNVATFFALAHDPEKHVLDPDRVWAPVFGKDHAQTKSKLAWLVTRST
jgi:hypothetical protein